MFFGASLSHSSHHARLRFRWIQVQLAVRVVVVVVVEEVVVVVVVVEVEVVVVVVVVVAASNAAIVIAIVCYEDALASATTGMVHSNLCSHFQSAAWQSFPQYLTILHFEHVVRGTPVGHGHAQYAHDVDCVRLLCSAAATRSSFIVGI
jgi:hypothetical protein